MGDVDQEFNFEVPEYSRRSVITLLQNYLDIRSTLIDRMPNAAAPVYSAKKNHEFREKPFGASKALPWPFMTKHHAPMRVDGKKRARMMEDLHCATLDLERALATLSSEEYSLIREYYIVGAMTMEDLAASRGLASKGRLQERLQRIVNKLVRHMNNKVSDYERP